MKERASSKHYVNALNLEENIENYDGNDDDGKNDDDDDDDGEDDEDVRNDDVNNEDGQEEDGVNDDGGQDDDENGQDEDEDDEEGQNHQYRRFYRSTNKFVKPWPFGKHLNENGDDLSQQFYNYFENFCFKCGHDSHVAKYCRTYREYGNIHDLCQICMQGLHKNCLSRRYDLRNESNEQENESDNSYVKEMLDKLINEEVERRMRENTRPILYYGITPPPPDQSQF
jgi:hypothetical protein